MAQVAQILENHRLPGPSDEFSSRPGRRRIPTADLRGRIVDGKIQIVRCAGRYDLVLPEIADRVRERDPKAVVTLPAPTSQPTAADDPYKDFAVPDDLMW
jgi:uncharacterized protein YaiL (DUF2058 family)